MFELLCSPLVLTRDKRLSSSKCLERSSAVNGTDMLPPIVRRCGHVLNLGARYLEAVRPGVFGVLR